MCKVDKIVMITAIVGFIGMICTPENESYWYIWLTSFFILFIASFLWLLFNQRKRY